MIAVPITTFRPILVFGPSSHFLLMVPNKNSENVCFGAVFSSRESTTGMTGAFSVSVTGVFMLLKLAGN